MGKPAARLTDFHTCPMVNPGPVPHVGGPILPTCSTNILIGNLPAARVTDKALCVGPVDVIVQGSPTVYFNNLLAARMGDMTAHGGRIIMGQLNVLIGDRGGGPGFKMTKPCLKQAAQAGSPFVKAAMGPGAGAATGGMSGGLGDMQDQAAALKHQDATPTINAAETFAQKQQKLADILKDYQTHTRKMNFIHGVTVEETAMMLARISKKKVMEDLRSESFEAANQAYPQPDDWDGSPGQWMNLGHNDAFRHTYWNARMSQMMGKEWTEKFATAHEGVPGNPNYQEAQDLYNNELGRRIYEDNPDATPELIAKKVQEAMDSGELIVVDSTGKLQWSDDLKVGDHFRPPPVKREAY